MSIQYFVQPPYHGKRAGTGRPFSADAHSPSGANAQASAILLQRRYPDPLDLKQFFNRLKRSVRLTVIDDSLSLDRTNTYQLTLQGRRIRAIHVNQPGYFCLAGRRQRTRRRN